MGCCDNLKANLGKLVMEAVGTLLFTMFFSTQLPATILLGLWILNIFMWKISGSHFNPAVSFAFMFRKDDKRMPWSLALSYMVAQTVGAYVGALLLNFYTFDLPIIDFSDKFIMRAVVQELLVSFFFVLFFLTSTDEKLLFTNEKAINCFILASAYVGSRSMFAGQIPGGYAIEIGGNTYGVKGVTDTWGAIANPAVAIGICMSTLFNEGFEAWKAIYLYPTVPFGGAFLAVLFFELVFKKASVYMEEQGAADDDDGVPGAFGEGKAVAPMNSGTNAYNYGNPVDVNHDDD